MNIVEQKGTAVDIAGSNDGTLVNGPACEGTGGAIGGALRFDGQDDYVDLGDVNVPGGDSLTISLWFKADDFGVQDARFISKATGQSGSTHYWMLSTINNTGLRFRVRAGGSTTTMASNTGEISTGQWYHVVGTYDGQTMRLYKNGQEIASFENSFIPLTVKKRMKTISSILPDTLSGICLHHSPAFTTTKPSVITARSGSAFKRTETP